MRQISTGIEDMFRKRFAYLPQNDILLLWLKDEYFVFCLFCAYCAANQ